MPENIFKLFLQVKNEQSSWSEEGDKAKDIIYEGEIQDGVPNGFGKLIHPEGDFYEGEFENGEYHGFGIYTDSDGETIEGNWIEGEFQTDETEDSSEEEKVTMIGTIEKFFFNNSANTKEKKL